MPKGFTVLDKSTEPGWVLDDRDDQGLLGGPSAKKRHNPACDQCHREGDSRYDRQSHESGPDPNQKRGQRAVE